MKPDAGTLMYILSQYTIVTKDIPITDGRYICGYVVPEDKIITLNVHNSPRTDIETLSHETWHAYDYINGNNLTDSQVEDLSQHYLLTPNYYKGIEDTVDKLKNWRGEYDANNDKE